MGLWRNIQRLASAGAVQGVVEPGPTDVLTPLQGVQVVDDVSHAVQPVRVPLSGYGATSPAGGIGTFASYELVAAPHGTLIRWVQHQAAATGAPSAGDDFFFTSAQVTLLNRVALTPIYLVDGPQLHTLTVGDAAAVLALTAPLIRFPVNGQFLDMFIPGGSQITWVTIDDNGASLVSFYLQDVP